MARRRSPGTSAMALVVLLFIAYASLASAQGRKVLGTSRDAPPTAPSFDMSLFLSAPPKGRIPVSSPSRNSHRVMTKEELISWHLARIDRILRRSVPSPGVGH
ncbi:hypothetical protein MLD38_037103 [Melastoma candidum]|uniref:Uncharacterized protein n=1 Tax=Melastoma candidum TaxID=119954 RepID=A0ACB9LM69_9MYRT|nr:hypothetical protein MLD38_037103 [Melastoma candidum]